MMQVYGLDAFFAALRQINYIYLDMSWVGFAQPWIESIMTPENTWQSAAEFCLYLWLLFDLFICGACLGDPQKPTEIDTLNPI